MINRSQIKLLIFWQEHPDVARWQNTSFPLYEDIADLIAGRHATGEGALSVTGPELRPELEHSADTPAYLALDSADSLASEDTVSATSELTERLNDILF